MAFNKKFFTTGGIVASSGACFTENVNPFTGTSADNGKLLYSFDTDASDASGVYNATPTDVDFGVSGKINTGVRFPQTTSQRIQFTNPISNASNADFNVSFFVKFRSITGTAPNFAYVLVGNPSNQYGTFQIYTYYHASGLVFMLQRSVSGSVYYSTNYDTDIPVSVTANTYHHISINYTASSYGIEIFKDGVSAGTSTLDQSAVLTQVTTSSLGYSDTNAANAFNGSLDQFRIFDRKLTSGSGSEIEALVNEQACVHTSTTDDNDYPVTNAAYYKLDNSAEDSKGTNDGTESNIEYRFGRYGQAAVFNGSSSKIALVKNSTISPANDFTYSLWFKSDGTTFQTLFSHLGNSNPKYGVFLNHSSDASQSIRFLYSQGTNSQGNESSSANVWNVGQWHHLVITKSSTAGLKGYLDNIEIITDATLTADFTPYTLQNGNSNIGVYQYQTSGGELYWFNGSIDQVRIFTPALSAENVTELYNEKPETDTSNFKAVLWEGTDTSNYISSVGMDLETSGGLAWIKRTNSSEPHALYDSIRGINKQLSSDSAAAEATNSASFQGFSSFEANGFFVDNNGGTNRAPNSYVGWVWKGGGTPVTIAVNSITGSTPSRVSSVSANPAAGFSIVSLDKPNANTDTYGHGLSSDGTNRTPEMIILKRTVSSDNWHVYHQDLTNTVRISLDSDAKKVTGTGVWGSTNPDENIFTLQNQTGGAHIAYCFTSVAGYQKISSYSAGSVGLRIYTTDDGTSSGSNGFRPSFVMIKNTTIDSTNWVIVDSRRPDKWLYANEDDADATVAGGVVLQDDGFSLGNQGSYINASGSTYIYMAIK
jgi:hypothetical protein